MISITEHVESAIGDRRPLLDLSSVVTADGYITGGFEAITALHLEHLSGLTQVLKLRDNDLTELPEFVFALGELRQLWLNENEIADFPWSRIASLAKLRVIVLDENKIQTLPEDLSAVGHLQELSLAKNPIEDIQHLRQLHELRALNIRGTEVTEVPNAVLELPRLKDIKLGSPMPMRIAGLPTENIPYDILSRANNVKGVREFIRSTTGIYRAEDVRAAKVLFVGNTEVGKSTLIQNMKFGPVGTGMSPSRTPSISMSHFHTKNFIVNFWDLGGEERYRDVQQFFFTRNAVYILVTSLPLAKSRADWFPDRYWFELVNHVVGVEKESPDVEWILVINQLAGRPATPEDLSEIDALKSIFPLGTGVVRLSLFGEDNLKRDIEDLETKILTAIQRLPGTATESDLDVVRLSNKLKDLDRKIVSRALIEEVIVAELGGTADGDVVQRLARKLSEDGFVLDLSARDVQSRLVALDANEFVSELSKVFDAAEQTNGRLRVDRLVELCMNSEHTIALQPLLEELELCIRVSGHFNGYVVPVALPSIIGENSEPIVPSLERWQRLSEKYKEVVVEYRFKPVVPIGVFHRVACHQYAEHVEHMHHYREEFVLEYAETIVSAAIDLDHDRIVMRSIGSEAYSRLTQFLQQLESRCAYYNQNRAPQNHKIGWTRTFACNCSGCLGSQEPYRYEWDTVNERSDVMTCPRSQMRIGSPEIVHGTRKPVVFIAYESGDFHRANNIHRQLVDLGIDVLRYPSEAHPGSKLESNSSKWTRESDLTLFLVSKESLISQWCALEVALRIDQGQEEQLTLVARSSDLISISPEVLQELLDEKIRANPPVAGDAQARFELWRTRGLWETVLSRLRNHVFVDSGDELVLENGIKSLAAKLWQSRGR